MEVSAGGGFPAAPPGGLGGVGWGQGVSPKHCPPAPRRGPRRGLSSSPWWPDLTPASTLGSPALGCPPRQAGAQTTFCSPVHAVACPPPPTSLNSLFFPSLLN